MSNTSDALKIDYQCDQRIELAEAANDDPTPWEAFNDEVGRWARRALAANGFGDY